jgi:hypothetical protein
MKVNGITGASLVILGILSCIAAQAQERMSEGEEHTMKHELTVQERERIREASEIAIDGKKTPELVPYHIRMYYFFSRYGRPGHPYRAELQKQLSRQDDAILFAQAQIDDDLKLRDMEEHQAGFMSICAGGQTMTPLELATALEANTQRYVDRRAARYRAVMDQLSPEGQRLVTDFTFQRIRPVTGSHSAIIHATLAPEHFKKQVLDRYEAYRSGKMQEQQQLEQADRTHAEPQQPLSDKQLGVRSAKPLKAPK